MLIRHEFGGESAAYIRSYLQSNARFGKRLGRLLARREIEAGNTWGFVPDESPAHKRANFEAGGLFSRGPREEPNPFPKEQAVRWLSALVGVPCVSPRVLCVEEPVMQRTDLVGGIRPDINFFFCEDDVYWYAMGGELEDIPLEYVPLSGAISDPVIAMVTELPGGLDGIANRQSIGAEALEEMAAAAVAIIVGAWDYEGLLFWEPAKIDAP